MYMYVHSYPPYIFPEIHFIKLDQRAGNGKGYIVWVQNSIKSPSNLSPIWQGLVEMLARELKKDESNIFIVSINALHILEVGTLSLYCLPDHNIMGSPRIFELQRMTKKDKLMEILGTHAVCDVIHPYTYVLHIYVCLGFVSLRIWPNFATF
jgi:hypothetical protein